MPAVPSPPVAISLALAGAVVYGIADFLGGVAAGRWRALVVAAVSQAVGGVVLVPVALAVSGSPTTADLLFGGLAGISGALGVTLYYRGLALGPMGVVAPVASVVGALVPLTVGLATGERSAPLAAVGIGLAVVAIVLASWSPGEAVDESARWHTRVLRPGPALAFGAGLGFGGFFVFADATAEASGLWPLVSARVLGVGLLVLVLVALTRARRAATIGVGAGAGPGGGRDRPAGDGGRRTRGTVALVVGAGLFDQAANVLFLLATREGALTVVGVLISLYPVVVVALAAVVLGERLGPRFAMAAAAALVGSALIAGAS